MTLLRDIKRWFGNHRKRNAAPAKKRGRASLGLELLEGRALLSAGYSLSNGILYNPAGRAIDGGVQSFAVANNIVTDLHTNGNVFYDITGTDVPIDTGVVEMAVDSHGTVYDLYANGNLYGLNPVTGAGGFYGSGTQCIGAGTNGVVFQLQNGNVWQDVGGVWSSSPVDSGVTEMAVDNVGTAFDLYPNGNLYGLNPFVSGKGFYGAGTQAIGASQNGIVYQLQNGNVWRDLRGKWTEVDSGVVSMAVDGKGTVYDLYANGNLYGLNPFTGVWGFYGSGTQSIGAGADGVVYQLQNGNVWQDVDGVWSSKPVDSGVTQMAVDSLGTAFDLYPNGNLYGLSPLGSGKGFYGAGTQAIGASVNGIVYQLQNGNLWQDLGGDWTEIDMGVISFTVAANGALTIHDYLNTYGFSFGNFTINDGEPGISWGTVKGEFGGDQVDITVGIPFTSLQIDTGVPSPFGLAYWGAAAAAFNGNGACFGMALTSVLLAASGQTVHNLAETAALVTTIEENHLAQTSAQMINYFTSWALSSHNAQGIYNQLSGLLSSGDHPIITLGTGGLSGHAVVAYGLQPGPKGDGDFYIDVYDPNNPANSSDGSNLSVEMSTRIYIDPNSGWSYARYGWSGTGFGATSLMVIPTSVLAGGPTLPDSPTGLLSIVFGSDKRGSALTLLPVEPSSDLLLSQTIGATQANTSYQFSGDNASLQQSPAEWAPSPAAPTQAAVEENTSESVSHTAYNSFQDGLDRVFQDGFFDSTSRLVPE